MAYIKNVNKKSDTQLTYWPILSSLILLFVFAILCFPPLTAALHSAYVCLFCVMLWFALSFINDPQYYIDTKPFVLLSIVFYALTVIIPLICGYKIITNRYTSMSLVPLGFVIYDYYKQHGYTDYLRKIFLAVSALAAVTAITTYKKLLDSQYIVRSIKSTGEYSEILAKDGIGGYSFIYAVTAAAPIFLYIFLKSKKKPVRITALAAYAFSLLFIMKSNYMTAFLSVIISSAVFVEGYLLSKKKRGFILPAVFIIVSIAFVARFNSISGILEGILPNRISSVVFNPYSDSLVHSITEEFVNDRLPSYITSIKSFCQNPLLGILGSGRLDVSGKNLYGFGQHSHIFDTFALYGLIIGLLGIIVLVQPFRKNGRWVAEDRYFTAAIAVNMLFIYVFNNVTDSIAVIFTILFPLVRDYFEQKETQI